MTELTVTGGRPLRGRLRVPGDKSISHRALLLAALADGTSVIRGLADGDDVARTRRAVQALGAVVDGDRVTGGRLHEPGSVIDVGNSGTTIRLLAGLCAGFPWHTVLQGDESISRRPMDRVVEPLRQMGATVDAMVEDRYPPLVVRGGGLTGIDYTLPVPSAQVKSAVLLAGLHAEGETVVREPVPTRAHTEEMLARCGADLSTEPGVIRLRPSSLTPFTLDVPGDPSQAAFWVVAACIVPGSDLTVEGLYTGPARTGFVDVLRRMGADVTLTGDGTIRARSSALTATEIGGDEIPGLVDEVPVLAVAAAAAEGTTTIRDAAELRVKESDRVATIATELLKFGVKIEPRSDGIVVQGGSLHSARVRSHGDHRVAMAMAVAGMAAEGTTVVEGWEAVATSYPRFEEDLAACRS
jgi:3-phosphoshikimate 1-carboxyvinyltransferase